MRLTLFITGIWCIQTFTYAQTFSTTLTLPASTVQTHTAINTSVKSNDTPTTLNPIDTTATRYESPSPKIIETSPNISTTDAKNRIVNQPLLNPNNLSNHSLNESLNDLSNDSINNSLKDSSNNSSNESAVNSNTDSNTDSNIPFNTNTLPNTETDLWSRIRKGFAIPSLNTPLATHKTLWYANQPEYITRMIERGKHYLFYIVEELERRNMPSEIALLPFIESAFNPQAISNAKAAGIWQFMPATGKQFNLKQNIWRDERRGVIESTHAALNYLQKLHTMFGDWHLALAAYNWGEGSVQRAMNKNRAKGLSTDYLSLNMPYETANYIPKFQAIKNIIDNPTAYGIQLSPLSNTPYFTSIVKYRDIDVSLAAKFAGMSINEFKALNPSFKQPVIVGAHHPEILLPTDRLSLFNQSLSNYTGSLSSWTTVTLSSTEHPSTLAKRYGLKEKILREINHIPERMLLKPGSTLIVPKQNMELQTANISANTDNATINLAPELERRSLTVFKKDTWLKIANRANVSIAHLKQWNSHIKLKPGIVLSYYTTHNAPAVIDPLPDPIIPIKINKKEILRLKTGAHKSTEPADKMKKGLLNKAQSHRMSYALSIQSLKHASKTQLKSNTHSHTTDNQIKHQSEKKHKELPKNKNKH